MYFMKWPTTWFSGWGGPPPPTPVTERAFATYTEQELDNILTRTHIGTFELTGAIQPHPRNVPCEGYTYTAYIDPESHAATPVLMASASRRKLWQLFYDMMYELGEEVSVVLETSHAVRPKKGFGDSRHSDLYRENIDLPVLHSTLVQYEEPLLRDGCAGVAVFNPNIPLEVQFDEHKLIMAFGAALRPFADICERAGLRQRTKLQTVISDEHIHSSSADLEEDFQSLAREIGFGADELETGVPS